MEFILDIINTYGKEIVGAALVALAGILGNALKNLAAKHIDTKIKHDIARTVVQAVEQVYKHMGGPEKLAIALDNAAEMMAAQGITVTELELRMLLEAAVGEFNDVFSWSLPIMEGVAVEDLTDDQLREVAVQAGLSRSFVDGMTREQLEAELDKLAE